MSARRIRGGAPPALIDTTPAAGATVTEPLEWVYLNFDQVFEPNTATVRITGPDGENLAHEPAVPKHDLLTQRLPITTRPGTYRVNWQVADFDGNRVSGSHTFTLAPGITTTTPPPPTTTDAADAADADPRPIAQRRRGWRRDGGAGGRGRAGRRHTRPTGSAPA